MSPLRQARAASLTLRHAMGCKLRDARTLFPPCLACLEQHGAPCITTPWAGRWATPPRHVQPAEGARRLRLVRGCAPSSRAMDPRTALPPPAVLPSRPQRRSPSLYDEAESAQRITAASHLPSSPGLRAHPSATVCGFLAVTGRRSSELVALENDDVDLSDGLCTMRHTKCGTARWLPLHPTTQQALGGYVALRHGVYPIPPSLSFFVSAPGTRLTSWAVRATFVQLSRQIGLRGPRDSHGPR